MLAEIEVLPGIDAFAALEELVVDGDGGPEEERDHHEHGRDAVEDGTTAEEQKREERGEEEMQVSAADPQDDEIDLAQPSVAITEVAGIERAGAAGSNLQRTPAEDEAGQEEHGHAGDPDDSQADRELQPRHGRMMPATRCLDNRARASEKNRHDDSRATPSDG